MTDPIKDYERVLNHEQFKQTTPIPGFEALRYAGNRNKGFWPCLGDGTCIRSSDGAPIHFGCMAHLRMWAFKWYNSAGMIIKIPA